MFHALLYPPCVRAFWLERALPAAVRGPVEASQILVFRMRAAYSARRFGGQPFVFPMKLSIIKFLSDFFYQSE
jgi:hypothetical protein